MKMREKNYLVVGAGKSGIAAANLLLYAGCRVRLFDSNEALDCEAFKEKNPGLRDIEMMCGCLKDDWMKETDVLVLSPGVPTDLPFVQKMKTDGVEIIGEIELAYMLGKGRVIGITGTNGKTTTTTLVGEIMKAHFSKVDVVGNIGIPYTEVVLSQTQEQVTVAEISSFQLETIHTFHPVVSAILNITPDHLNRHHTMENYCKAKENICMNQTKQDVCVLNYDNEYTRVFGKNCNASVLFFSSSVELEDGYFYKDGYIYRAKPEKTTKIMHVSEMNLVGMCNFENVMAALAIAEAMDVPLETSLQVIRGFKAVEHRIEYVATKRGVDYYNDSKGTNPDAAIQGIKAMTKPTILIGGGYDKGSEYDEWIQNFDNKVKLLVLTGATKEKIAACAKKYGVTQIVMADTFEEVLDICVENAEAGDAVLLSPACASWGMFKSYEERGNVFKEFVNAIREN